MTVIIDNSGITGVKPAVNNGFGRSLRVLIISFENRIAFGQQLTGVRRLYLNFGQGGPDGIQSDVVGAVDNRGGCGFGALS